MHNFHSRWALAHSGMLEIVCDVCLLSRGSLNNTQNMVNFASSLTPKSQNVFSLRGSPRTPYKGFAPVPCSKHSLPYTGSSLIPLYFPIPAALYAKTWAANSSICIFISSFKQHHIRYNNKINRLQDNNNHPNLLRNLSFISAVSWEALFASFRRCARKILQMWVSVFF